MKYFIIICFIFVCSISFCQNKLADGYVKYYYPNGAISSEGLMTKGKPDGIWKTYYISGLIKSTGKRINHLLDSTWVFFSETGDTTEKISYNLGKKNGYYLKYSSLTDINSTKVNRIISRELYVNDSKEGLSYYFYSNGKLKEIVNYKGNKKSGFSREFNQDSILITIYEYINNYLIDKQVLNRTNDNKPVGIWKDFYSNGNLKNERSFKDGELDGYVREFDIKGSLVDKKLYRDGKMQTLNKEDSLDIEEKITYFDDKKIKTSSYFKKGIPVGIHREYDESGNVVNSWIYDSNGKLTGSGIIKDDGTREGKFTYFNDDGSIKSEGVYNDNRQNGKWLFYFKKGKFEQVGSFSNGYLNGEWKWFYSDSSVLRCENFIRGKRNGLFFELNQNHDTIVKGYYTDNLKSGYWVIKSGDITEKGSYVNDLKDGIWKAYYSNDALMYEGNYIQGNPDGKHFFYYDNKIIKEEQFYVNGIKEKVWKKYNEDGTLFLNITYQNDTETRINGIKLEIIKNN